MGKCSFCKLITCGKSVGSACPVVDTMRDARWRRHRCPLLDVLRRRWQRKLHLLITIGTNYKMIIPNIILVSEVWPIKCVQQRNSNTHRCYTNWKRVQHLFSCPFYPFHIQCCRGRSSKSCSPCLSVVSYRLQVARRSYPIVETSMRSSVWVECVHRCRFVIKCSA